MKLTEHALFFPVLRLATNGSAALMSIHQRYGNLVAVRFINKKFLFITKPESIEQVFSQEAKGNANRDALHEAKKSMIGDGLASSKDETWTNQRRLMQPFFNKDTITVWQDVILADTQQIVERLKADTTREINITQEMKSLVQGIIARILFGQSVNDDEKHTLMANVDSIIKGAVPVLMADLLGKNWLKHLFFLQNARYKRAVNEFSGFVARAVASDKQAEGLIAQLSRARDKQSSYIMPEQLLKDEAITLFLAGQDTTINTLVWFFYLLGKHSEIHEHISAEIAAFRHEPLTADLLQKYAYTKAALQETLRRYPAGIGVSRNLSVDSINLDGHDIGRDTTLFVSLYATHHDPALWAKPNSFYPEHFVDPEQTAKRHRFAYLPFGGGIHNCIGRHLAELEMMLIIISLLREFRFKTEMTVKTAVSITLKPDRDVFVKSVPIGK
ncbi:cytochrome P450 family 4 subfamily V [biofilm metagenome]